MSLRPYKTKLILGMKGWENLMDHSDRVGPLETFDLNEKLGHLHDLNDTHDLNVTSQWPQQPHNDLTVTSQWPQRPHNDLTVTSTTSMEVMSSQKMTEFDDFNLLNDLNEE